MASVRPKKKHRMKNKKRMLSENSKIKNPKTKKLEKAPIANDSDSDVAESESDRIQKLLEPYSKDQLIDFLCDAAMNDSSLLQHIRTIADQDISQRKIFVHGFGWDTTRETLISIFEPYGKIEDCNVVVDRVTAKAKGYGFVIFKSRAGAAKALKEPHKKINNRLATCQLASIGPAAAHHNQDTTGRKIYVSNVHADADPEKLRVFFAKFGEIESGPSGFDMSTGKSRGFALFVYKTQEGAKKALEEPHKMFEGHQLHCRRANENKNKPVVLQQTTVQPPVLAAVAAAQNLALFRQHPSLNPMYSGLVVDSNSGFITGSVNPMVAGAMNPGLIPSAQVAGSSFGTPVGLGGYGASHGLGILGGGPSMIGAPNYMNPAGLQSYQNSQLGTSSSSRTPAPGESLTGYPSYMR